MPTLNGRKLNDSRHCHASAAATAVAANKRGTSLSTRSPALGDEAIWDGPGLPTS